MVVLHAPVKGEGFGRAVRFEDFDVRGHACALDRKS